MEIAITTKEVAMTITFRIENGNNVLPPTPAILTPDQLGSLRELLVSYTPTSGGPMLTTIEGDPASPSFMLIARVCPLALAVLSRCFDYDPAAIGVIDEAQFLSRKVLIWQQEKGADIKMGLSLNPDTSPELNADDAVALALLEKLGIDARNAGIIAVAELRDRLTNPRIRRRLDEDPNLAPFVETLTEMAAVKPVEGENLLAWI